MHFLRKLMLNFERIRGGDNIFVKHVKHCLFATAIALFDLKRLLILKHRTLSNQFPCVTDNRTSSARK